MVRRIETEAVTERPREVRAATLVWVGAVAAGAAEAGVFTYGLIAEGVPWIDLLPGLGTRALVYVVVLTVVALLHRGHRWARWALALGPGIVGTFSLVVEPLEWLLAGGATDGPPALTGAFAAIVVLRGVHLAAVAAGLVLMFRPKTNAYFRARRRV